MQAVIDRALKILGIKNFLLGIHDAAFPGRSEEDLGRGSPYSEGAAEFLGFVRSLGFNGVQLGPQGITSPHNSSPYDGSFFSRNFLSLAPLALTRPDCRLLDPEKLARLTAQLPVDSTRVNDGFARQAVGEILVEISTRHRKDLVKGNPVFSTSSGNLFGIFCRKNAAWLVRDALYEKLEQLYGGRNWRHWDGQEEAGLDKKLFGPPAGLRELACLRYGALQRLYSEAVEDYCFIQFLLMEQHRELRRRCRKLGLKLFGDCQIGFSDRDAWAAQSFLLPDYRHGCAAEPH